METWVRVILPCLLWAMSEQAVLANTQSNLSFHVPEDFHHHQYDALGTAPIPWPKLSLKQSSTISRLATLTAVETNPWYQIDFGSNRLVNRITVIENPFMCSSLYIDDNAKCQKHFTNELGQTFAGVFNMDFSMTSYTDASFALPLGWKASSEGTIELCLATDPRETCTPTLSADAGRDFVLLAEEACLSQNLTGLTVGADYNVVLDAASAENGTLASFTLKIQDLDISAPLPGDGIFHIYSGMFNAKQTTATIEMCSGTQFDGRMFVDKIAVRPRTQEDGFAVGVSNTSCELGSCWNASEPTTTQFCSRTGTAHQNGIYIHFLSCEVSGRYAFAQQSGTPQQLHFLEMQAYGPLTCDHGFADCMECSTLDQLSEWTTREECLLFCNTLKPGCCSWHDAANECWWSDGKELKATSNCNNAACRHDSDGDHLQDVCHTTVVGDAQMCTPDIFNRAVVCCSNKDLPEFESCLGQGDLYHHEPFGTMLNWHDADAFCTSMEGRLCTPQEVLKCSQMSQILTKPKASLGLAKMEIWTDATEIRLWEDISLVFDYAKALDISTPCTDDVYFPFTVSFDLWISPDEESMTRKLVGIQPNSGTFMKVLLDKTKEEKDDAHYITICWSGGNLVAGDGMCTTVPLVVVERKWTQVAVKYDQGKLIGFVNGIPSPSIDLSEDEAKSMCQTSTTPPMIAFSADVTNIQKIQRPSVYKGAFSPGNVTSDGTIPIAQFQDTIEFPHGAELTAAWYHFLNITAISDRLSSNLSSIILGTMEGAEIPLWLYGYNWTNSTAQPIPTIDIPFQGLTITFSIYFHEVSGLDFWPVITVRLNDVAFSLIRGVGGLSLRLLTDQPNFGWVGFGQNTNGQMNLIENLNKWLHMALVYNGKAVYIYVDGVIDIEATEDIPAFQSIDTATITIGQNALQPPPMTSGFGQSGNERVQEMSSRPSISYSPLVLGKSVYGQCHVAVEIPRGRQRRCDVDSAQHRIHCCSSEERDQRDGFEGTYCTGSALWVASKFPDYGGCQNASTWDDADAFCRRFNARLCTKDEVGSRCTIGEGCGMNEYVWTSTTGIASLGQWIYHNTTIPSTAGSRNLSEARNIKIGPENTKEGPFGAMVVPSENIWGPDAESCEHPSFSVSLEFRLFDSSSMPRGLVDFSTDSNVGFAFSIDVDRGLFEVIIYDRHVGRELDRQAAPIPVEGLKFWTKLVFKYVHEVPGTMDMKIKDATNKLALRLNSTEIWTLGIDLYLVPSIWQMQFKTAWSPHGNIYLHDSDEVAPPVLKINPELLTEASADLCWPSEPREIFFGCVLIVIAALIRYLFVKTMAIQEGVFLFILVLLTRWAINFLQPSMTEDTRNQVLGFLHEASWVIDSISSSRLLCITMPLLIFYPIASLHPGSLTETKYTSLFLALLLFAIMTAAMGALGVALISSNWDLPEGKLTDVQQMSMSLLFAWVIIPSDGTSILALAKKMAVTDDMTACMINESTMLTCLCFTACTLWLQIGPGYDDMYPDKNGWWYTRTIMLKLIPGIPLGYGVGWVMIRSWDRVDAVQVIMLTFPVLYALFFLCEIYLGISGAFAVYGLAVCCCRGSHHRLSPQVKTTFLSMTRAAAEITCLCVLCLAAVWSILKSSSPKYGSQFVFILAIYVVFYSVRIALVSATLILFDKRRSIWGSLFVATDLHGATGLVLGMLLYNDDDVDKSEENDILYHTTLMVVITQIMHALIAKRLQSNAGLFIRSHLIKLEMSHLLHTILSAQEKEMRLLQSDAVLGDSNWRQLRETTIKSLRDPYAMDANEEFRISQTAKAKSDHLRRFKILVGKLRDDTHITPRAARMLLQLVDDLLARHSWFEKDEMKPILSQLLPDRMELWYPLRIIPKVGEMYRAKKVRKAIDLAMAYIHVQSQLSPQLDHSLVGLHYGRYVKKGITNSIECVMKCVRDLENTYPEITRASKTQCAGRIIVAEGLKSAKLAVERGFVHPSESRLLSKQLKEQMEKVADIGDRVQPNAPSYILEHNPWTIGISRTQKELVQYQASHREAPANAVLLAKGELATGGGLILITGGLAQYNEGSAVRYLGPTRFVNLYSVLTGRPSLHTVTCVTNVSYTAFHIPTLNEVLTKKPFLHGRLWRLLGKEMAVCLLSTTPPFCYMPFRKLQQHSSLAQMLKVRPGRPIYLDLSQEYIILKGQATLNGSLMPWIAPCRLEIGAASLEDITQRHPPHVMARFQNAFAQFDTKKRGYIDSNSVIPALRDIGCNYAEKEVLKMLNTLDIDDDIITFEHFMRIVEMPTYVFSHGAKVVQIPKFRTLDADSDDDDNSDSDYSNESEPEDKNIMGHNESLAMKAQPAYPIRENQNDHELIEMNPIAGSHKGLWMGEQQPAQDLTSLDANRLSLSINSSVSTDTNATYHQRAPSLGLSAGHVEVGRTSPLGGQPVPRAKAKGPSFKLPRVARGRSLYESSDEGDSDEDPAMDYKQF